MSHYIIVHCKHEGCYDYKCIEDPENNTKITEYPIIILAIVILFTFIVIRTWVVGIKYIKLHLKKDGM